MEMSIKLQIHREMADFKPKVTSVVDLAQDLDQWAEVDPESSNKEMRENTIAIQDGRKSRKI
jgi:hypothetical protein